MSFIEKGGTWWQLGPTERGEKLLLAITTLETTPTVWDREDAI